jgi:cobalt-zinc-cadmium efflux system outer membrane protein
MRKVNREFQPPNSSRRKSRTSWTFNAAHALAQARRPELHRLELQRRQAETELELQRNQLAPGIDINVMGAQDFGTSPDKPNREELYAGVSVEIPLQRRAATGRAHSAGANLQRIKHEHRLAEDRIAAEVRDALSALSAAHRRQELAAGQVAASEHLETGERTRYEMGDSTLLVVNLREIASGDAALLKADATIAERKAQADLHAALGLDRSDGNQ